MAIHCRAVKNSLRGTHTHSYIHCCRSGKICTVTRVLVLYIMVWFGGSRFGVLKGLSHEMDLASDDMVSSRPKYGTSRFLNFLAAQMIL
jgi:hypothetical protein